MGAGASGASSPPSLWQGTHYFRPDGANDYAQDGNLSASWDFTQAITFGAWIKFTSSTTFMHPFGDTTAGATLVGSFGFYTVGGGLRCGIGRNATTMAGWDFGSVNDNTWRLFTISKPTGANSNITGYINGSQSGSAGIYSSYTPNYTQNITIGKRPTLSSGYFAGGIRDAFVIFGYEMNSSEHASLYDPSFKDLSPIISGLGDAAYYWEFGASGDDATGTTGVFQELLTGTNDLTPYNTLASALTAL